MSELCDILDDVLRECPELGRRGATVGQGRGRYTQAKRFRESEVRKFEINCG